MRSDGSVSFKEILRRIRKGGDDGNDALSEVLDMFVGMMRAIGKSMHASNEDIESAIHDTMVKLYFNSHRIVIPAGLPKWIETTFCNTIIDIIRGNIRREKRAKKRNPMFTPQCQETGCDEQDLSLLYGALEMLAEDDRLIILYSFVADKSPSQILELVGKEWGLNSSNSVIQKIRRAVLKLRKAFQKLEEEFKDEGE